MVVIVEECAHGGGGGDIQHINKCTTPAAARSQMIN